MSSSTGTNLNRLRPSQVAAAIPVMRRTDVALYVHGAPGISKSAVAAQAADTLNIALIDVRGSQMAPEDFRGVPMRGERHGISGLIWEPPLNFPRDLDYDKMEQVEGTKTIRFFNPLGNNDIHYCTNPTITVTAVDASLIATIIESSLDRFRVTLHDAGGLLVAGLVRWTVCGSVEAIFALEELNSAPPAVQAAAYQLIFERQLGDYVLPKGVMIIATGNRDGDKGITYKLPKPLANRFVHVEMVVSFDDWLAWAVNSSIHPEVIGYLMKWPSKLFEEKFAQYATHSFATPRSWEFVSKIISQSEVPTEALHALICGAIGDAVGTEFILHRQFIADMPDITAVFNGTAPPFQPQRPEYTTQIGYSLSVQICYALKARADDIKRKHRSAQEGDRSPEQHALWNDADRGIGYIMDNFQPEMAMLAYRIALGTYKLRFSSTFMTRFAQFAAKYDNLVMSW